MKQPKTLPKTFHVKSFGCQMNVYDSQRMADTLAPEGYVETASVEDADLVILNTCHIREKAAEKVYSELGRVRRLKEAAAADGRRVLIAVAGCVAQAEGAEIVRRAPAVDLTKARPERRSPRAMFTRALLVSMSNPKTLLFYGAFFPQFVSAEHAFAPQVTLLSVSFVAIAILVDGGWALISPEEAFASESG